MSNLSKGGRIFVRTLSYLLAVAIGTFAGICISTGWFPGVGNMGPGIGQSKLEELEKKILDMYIGGADPTVLEDAAAAAMVAATGDRWSYYISAADYQDSMDSKNNSYVGIGVTIQLLEDGSGIKVLQVEPEGPAQEAGILPGDVLIEAAGQSLAGLDTTQASTYIKGEAGTFVDIGLLRDGQRVDVKVQRRVIQREVATYQLLEGNIGYIRIRNFNSRCASETIAAIEDLRSQGAQKLIFDVRFNPGGYVSELVDLLDYLLPEGLLFRSVDYTGAESRDNSDASCLEMPMAVLVNGDSYSAAEFFAAALREYEWATVVGTQTVGKGNFQYTLRLSDGSAVALSTGRYYTPKGISLAEVGGLTPDVPVQVDSETAALIYSSLLEPEEDPQIQAAIQALAK